MRTFICYPTCSTCKKAEKWLKDHHVQYEKRDISIDHPTYEELKEWHSKSDRPLTKFFNTSGKKYRELNLKEQLKTMSEEEMLRLLASDGMLVKRPVLTGKKILVGFREEEWEEALL